MNETIGTTVISPDAAFIDAAAAFNHDDDDVLDGWLASLTPGSFELFLNSLAATEDASAYALQPTA